MHLNKVAETTLTISVTHTDVGKYSEVPIDLPISPEDFQSGLKIPLDSIQGIWKKASELVGETASISPAPGYGPECKMVISRKGKRLHLVTQSKRGKYSCDSDCCNWKSLGVCSHTVAVAHVNGQLQEFCDHYKHSKRLPNVSKLV